MRPGDMWTEIAVSQPVLSPERFKEAVLIWVEKPHTINRRLAGIKPLNHYLLKNCESEQELCCLISKIASAGTEELHCLFETCSAVETTDILHSECGTMTVLLERNLLPKHMYRFQSTREVVILSEDFVVFCNTSKDSTLSPRCTYKLSLDQGNRIHLELLGTSNETDTSVAWLKEHVLHKVCKWACSAPINHKQVSVPSLGLVSIEKYSATYFNLKKKYGQHLCKIWPENTDPLKFVYEDIAIASYLITLWEQDDVHPSFLDVGCGNGLLVYLLSAEGYEGMGIDIRKRKIWDHYGPDTNLMEGPITPDATFPQYTWWIGNHSDELTPWIPYLASRSRADAKVFLLPCCPFTFDGKYQRQHGGISQYQSYLLFLQKLCSSMGFCVELDKLRIPSTKRICLVCKPLPRDPDSVAQFCEDRTNFVKQYTTANCIPKRVCFGDLDQEHREETEADSLAISFEPRSKVEEVRNCTQLNKKFLETVVDRIASHLLQVEPQLPVPEDLPRMDAAWCRGGTVCLGSLVQLLSEAELQTLKNQCGGLQTLLKNHRHVFLVKNGSVCLNTPSNSISKPRTAHPGKNSRGSASKRTSKQKQCWFFEKHPQGCPVNDAVCPYTHNQK